MHKTLIYSVLIAAGCLTAPAAVAQGSAGVSNTDWYTNNPAATTFAISTAAELAGLAQIVNGTWGGTQDNFFNKTINLTADIDLSAYGSGTGWEPIGTGITWTQPSFSGIFDGGLRSISGLYINRNADNQGLFGTTDNAVIRNVILEGAQINVGSGNRIGGIVGNAFSTQIQNCAALDINITGGASQVGGIAGYFDGMANNVNMHGCFVSGFVSGTSYIGGLAGSAGPVNFDNSYTSCDVTGTGNNVGGLIGYNGNRLRIEYCFALGNITGRDSVGGLIGWMDGTGTVLLNSVALNSSVTGTAANASNVGALSGFLAGSTEYSIYAVYEMVIIGSGGSGAFTPWPEADMKTVIFWTDPDEWATNIHLGGPFNDFFLGGSWDEEFWHFVEGHWPELHKFRRDPISHSVTIGVNDDSYGTVVGSGTYEENATVQVEALANDCYHFVSWTANGIEVSTENPYTFTARDVELVANFQPLELDFDTYAPILWNNTLMLNLAKLRNSGHVVTGCRWFKDGAELTDTRTADEYSYSAGNNKNDQLESTVAYSFRVTTENCGVLHSTSKTILPYGVMRTGAAEAGGGLTAYPNPVPQGGSLTLEGVAQGSPIQVYSYSGAQVQSVIATDSTATLTLSLPSGMYVIRAEGKEVKIFVTQ